MDEGAHGSRLWLCSAALVVAVVAIVTFATTLGHGFAYDDEWTVVKNPHLDRDLSVLLRASFSGEARALGIPDGTRPAMIASMWLDHRLFGRSAAGYHAHSLLLHAACSVAALYAGFALLGRRWLALGAALFFAVAPVHAEVVAAMNYREDLLASLAVLGVFAWFAWPSRRPDSIDGAVVAGGAFALGLLSKASAIVLVPLALGWWAAPGRSPHTRRARRPSLISLALVATLWGTWRGWLRLTGRDDVPAAFVERGLVGRLVDTARYELRAVADSMWPLSWAPDHPPEPAAHAAWLGAALLLVAIGAPWLRRRATSGAAQALVWMVVAPLATSPLVGPLNARADRYLYLGVFGAGCLWMALAAKVAQPATQKMRHRRPVFQVLGLLAVVGLAWRAQAAAAAWRSNASLWRAAVAQRPGSARGWTALSRQLRNEGDLGAAEAAIATAISLDPKLLRARVTAVYNALAMGEVALARRRITEVDRLRGRDQRGMAQARRCARLPAAEAQKCARAP